MTPSLLKVENVTRRFGGLTANAGINMEARQGEILGLIGPNGAGKSTLFNLIAGTFPPSEGKITFGGQDITRLSAADRCGRGIARTFQVVKSFDTMSVIENIMVGGFVHTSSAREARQAASDILDFTGLSGRAETPAGELTPPEKRRLEMARALATKPKLLLLDEVMTGLTPAEAQKGVELVRKIRDTGVTIIMVEHVMEVVMPLVDRAVVLHLGRVLAEGKPQDVARDEAVISAYLGERRRA